LRERINENVYTWVHYEKGTRIFLSHCDINLCILWFNNCQPVHNTRRAPVNVMWRTIWWIQTDWIVLLHIPDQSCITCKCSGKDFIHNPVTLLLTHLLYSILSSEICIVPPGGEMGRCVMAFPDKLLTWISFLFTNDKQDDFERKTPLL
jgi:hypothetical protein